MPGAARLAPAYGDSFESDWVQVSRPARTNEITHHRLASHQVQLVDWLWLSVAVLLSLVLRIPFFRIPMLADEGGYAYATQGWVNGTGELYGDLWISRPQAIFFVYAGIFDLFGTGTTAIRFAAWIAIALTVIAVWGFARICATPLAANITALTFAVGSSLPNLEGYSANSEMFMGLPAALSALWLLRIGRTGWSRWQLVGVGILIGIAISLKPSAAVMLPITMLFVVLTSGSDASRDRLMRCLWPTTGVAIIGIASLINGWMLGWDNFIYATFTYRLSAQSAATVGIQHNLEAIGRLAWRSSALIGLIAVLLVFRYRASIVAAVRAFGNLQQVGGRAFSFGQLRHWLSMASIRGWINEPRSDGRLLLRLWLLGGLFGASIGGDWWSHYLIQVIAPLSIWVGWTIAIIWPELGRIGRSVLATASVLLLVAPFWVLVHGSPDNMARAMFSHPGYPAQDKVAAYLREHSEPGIHDLCRVRSGLDLLSCRPSAGLPASLRSGAAGHPELLR